MYILITFGILAYLYLTSQSYNKKKINGEYTLLVNISYSKFKECNDIIANETWVYLISKIENSRKSAIKSGMRSSLLKTKHKKMDVLKSVRGNKKKLAS